MGTAANVIVGTAQAYIAPANTPSPVINATTGLVTTPSAPWVAVGFTEGGVTLNVDRKVTNIMVEEQSTPILVVPESTDVTIDIAFAEDTVLNMQTAYGGGVITTVAGNVDVVAGVSSAGAVLTRATGSFVADGVVAGSTVVINPASTGTGDIPASYVITGTVTATTITLTTAPTVPLVGATINIIPSVPVAGTTSLTLADALTAFSIALVATSPAGLGRLVYVPNLISGSKVKTTYNRAKANRSYSATFTAVCPLSGIVITDVLTP